MNKKYIIGGIVLSLLVPAASYADTTTSTGPTIAILDTAIDTSIPELNGKIIYAFNGEWEYATIGEIFYIAI
jgi:hypothetical protein